jgi:hypothetical protein
MGYSFSWFAGARDAERPVGTIDRLFTDLTRDYAAAALNSF